MIVGEKIEREPRGRAGKVVLVCCRAEYGCPEGKRSEPDPADSGYVGRGKCMGE